MRNMNNNFESERKMMDLNGMKMDKNPAVARHMISICEMLEKCEVDIVGNIISFLDIQALAIALNDYLDSTACNIIAKPEYPDNTTNPRYYILEAVLRYLFISDGVNANSIAKHKFMSEFREKYNLI